MIPQPSRGASTSKPCALEPDPDDVMVLLGVPANRIAWARRVAREDTLRRESTQH